MSRPAKIQSSIFVSLAVATITASWWGCSTTPEGQPTGGATSNGGAAGHGTGGDVVHIDGGVGGGEVDEAGACTSTSAEAHRVPLDIVVILDRSGSMTGAKWQGVTSALSTFFNDPASAGISVGLVYMPSLHADSCATASYETLDVPIDVLPQNAFNLTNSFPADAQGYGTPTYAALKGALTVATAHQDAHPTHKVITVFATDGDPFACSGGTIEEDADLAGSARDYNGVQTFVIGVQGSTIANLDKIAAAGGTTEAYDVTSDVTEFAAKMAEIRRVALGCEFTLPSPPNNMQLDPDKVNFSYTPKGVGMPKILLRADDLLDCGGQPGWYYDDNQDPTKILLCPASCATVEADVDGKVDVLFGCKSLIN